MIEETSPQSGSVPTAQAAGTSPYVFGFISSHKGGQHTNGPDYGKVTIRHDLAGIYIEVQTHSRMTPHKARDLGVTLIELAIGEAR